MSIIKGKNYKYGIHVPDMKFYTKDSLIEDMPPKNKVYICLSQHIGAPATPIVNVGDEVKIGQLIGESSGAVSANVYSSICGIVTEITDLVNGMGQKQKYIVIENNGKTDEILFDKIADYQPSTLVERIRLAGIVGLGGAGFPTSVKLSPKAQAQTLIINGAECEPYLTVDYRLMLEQTEAVYKGIMLVAKALNVSEVILGIEANKPQAIKAFSKYDGLKIVVLKKQYPMGSEKHLIYCCTGKKVPCGKIPIDVGCVVQNIKTVLACYEAIELNKPLTKTHITISGNGINSPKNVRVSIGTPFTEIVEYCGGKKDDVIKYIAGGPMMGKALISLDHYAKKTDSGLLLLTKDEANTKEPSNCINCGKCADNCPMRLIPAQIDFYVQGKDYITAEKLGVMNCIECGSCAYNCPAKRPLTQSFSFAKGKIKEIHAKEIKK